jgi:Fe2+ transport system protein FeoA
VSLEPDEVADERSLDSMKPKQRGVIARLGGDPSIARRLMELGLTPGTPITVVRRAPLGDPIEVSVRGLHLSLRRSEASHIHVASR